MTSHPHEIHALSRKWGLSSGAAARASASACPVLAGTLRALSRHQAAAQLQVRCCLWTLPRERFQVRLGVDLRDTGQGRVPPGPPHVYGLTCAIVSHGPPSTLSSASPAGACLSAGSQGGRPRPWRSRSASSPPGSAVQRDTSLPAPLKRSHRVTHCGPGFPYLLFTDVSEAGAKWRPKREGRKDSGFRSRCGFKVESIKRFIEILLGSFKVFMSNSNK